MTAGATTVMRVPLPGYASRHSGAVEEILRQISTNDAVDLGDLRDILRRLFKSCSTSERYGVRLCLIGNALPMYCDLINETANGSISPGLVQLCRLLLDGMTFPGGVHERDEVLADLKSFGEHTSIVISCTTLYLQSKGYGANRELPSVIRGALDELPLGLREGAQALVPKLVGYRKQEKRSRGMFQ